MKRAEAQRDGGFKDHFSHHACAYARHRPEYPEALFAWLADIAPATELAWDAGTGNGQAARGLAARFARVHASDASRDQIAHAPPFRGVVFLVEPAERCSLEDGTVDLVTVGQALHWFDLERFYAEVARVLRPGGVLAAWTYALCAVTPGVDTVIRRLYDGILGGCWPPERRHVEAGYRDLPFPFREIEPPVFCMQASMTLGEFTGYLGTWSAVQRYRRARGSDPLAGIEDELRQVWGAADGRRTVEWPLAMRVGRGGD